MKFEKHVFICTNERAAGERKSCGNAHGLELVKCFKKQLKDLGLNTKIRAQQPGCLDACEHGPALVVYPDGVFYGGVEISDVDQIVNDHLINNKPVERLVINFNESD
ncbi:MAG: (2Fe-2S) ferredoxin domain-containing protein [Bacteroidetes bacterium]|nr:(2Fe-2S) ferredoxin domain-containing protein [Bacteroidota bacterium]